MADPRPANTRWLDDGEQQVWRSYLAATQLLFERLNQELQQQSGLPHTYYEVLVHLSEAPRRQLRMSELAKRSLSSRSRLSHAIARLQEAGWVRREGCDTDRRGQLAVLTDEGFAVLAGAAPGHVESVRTYLFDPLTREQVEQLGDICHAIVERLKRPRTPGAVAADDC
jgi:DNA-binding MarR family transcriptional regulator